LIRTLKAAYRQHRLLSGERELLEKTLHGSIHTLMNVLGLMDPLAFGRASRLQREVRAVARTLGVEERWSLEAAAMLSQLGTSGAHARRIGQALLRPRSR
jgi:hypothetical protein